MTPEAITPNDIEALVQLFTEAGPFVSPRGRSDYWLYARLFGSTCLCVRVDGSLAGALLAFRDQSIDGSEIYIQDIAVNAAYRKRGIGQALMAELEKRAREWGVTRLWLTSEPENAGALSLWGRLGYVNREADYQTDDGIWITRDLKGPGRDRAVFELSIG